ncbi:MAG: repeat protein [Planctomycetaceae bacterium]|nr:repeat protein [Planctomycetaceae bacterium]
MRAKFKCPACENVLVIDTETVGTGVTCEHCGKKIKVSRAGAKPGQSSPPTISTEPRSTGAGAVAPKPAASSSQPNGKKSAEDDFLDDFQGDLGELEQEQKFEESDTYGLAEDGSPDDLPPLELKKKKKKKSAAAAPPPSPPAVSIRSLSEQPRLVLVGAGGAIGVLCLVVCWILFSPARKPLPEIVETPSEKLATSNSIPTSVTTPDEAAKKSPTRIPRPDWSNPDIDVEPLALKYGRPIDEWIAQSNAPDVPDPLGVKDPRYLERDQLRAINALGVFRSKTPQVLSVLVPRLASKSPGIRQTARDAIRWLKPQPAQLLQHLRQLLESPQVSLEALEVASLLKAEGSGFLGIYSKLESKPEFESAAANAIVSIGAACVPELLKQLGEKPDLKRQLAIVQQLGRIGPGAHAATEKLLALTSENPKAWQAHPLGALAAIVPDDPRFHQLMTEAVKSKNWVAVNLALANLPHSVAALQPLMLDVPTTLLEKPLLRSMVLTHFPAKPEVIPRLIAWGFQHPIPNPTTRGIGQTTTYVGEIIVREVISEIGDAAVPALTEILKGNDPVLKRGAMRTLIWIRSPATAEPLLAFAEQESDPLAIWDALLAAIRAGVDHSRLAKFLLPGSKLAPEEQKRLAAGIQTPADQKFVDAAVKCLIDSRTNPQLTDVAYNLLQASGPNAAVAIPELIEIVRTNPEKPGRALDILMNIGAPAVPELLKIWTTNDRLQQLVLYAFSRMGNEASVAIPEILNRLQDSAQGFPKNIRPEEPLHALAQILRDQRAGAFPMEFSESMRTTLLTNLVQNRSSVYRLAGCDEFLLALKNTDPRNSVTICGDFFGRLRGFALKDVPIPMRISKGEREVLWHLARTSPTVYRQQAACLLYCAGEEDPEILKVIEEYLTKNRDNPAHLRQVISTPLESYQNGFGKTGQERAARILQDIASRSEKGQIRFVDWPYPKLKFGPDKILGQGAFPIPQDQFVARAPDLTVQDHVLGSTISVERIANLPRARHQPDSGLISVFSFINTNEPISSSNWELIPVLVRKLVDETEMFDLSKSSSLYHNLDASVTVWTVVKDPRARLRLEYFAEQLIEGELYQSNSSLAATNPSVIRIDERVFDTLDALEKLGSDRKLRDGFWQRLLVEGLAETRQQTAMRMWQRRQHRETADLIAKGLGFDKPIVSLAPGFATNGIVLWDLCVLMEEDAEALRPGLESLKNHPAIRVRCEVHRILEGLKPRPATQLSAARP